MDKLLTDGGCKSAYDGKDTFSYTSKASKRLVCKIKLGKSDCAFKPNGNHLPGSGSIISQLPQHMLEYMKSGRECGVCAKNNPDFVQCRHGGPYTFTHDGSTFQRCRFDGPSFALDNSAERDLFRKWIELELASA